MTVWPVDDRDRVWAVANLLDPPELAHVVSLPWTQFAWRRESLQEHIPRRSIRLENIQEEIDQMFRDRMRKISEITGYQIDDCVSNWWLDEPGFVFDIHTDGELPAAMQIYWSAPSDNFGTVFYYYKNKSKIMHRFVSRPNHGYIMFNHANDDGSQPLLWHDMPNTVPNGSYRLSSYSYLRVNQR